LFSSFSTFLSYLSIFVSTIVVLKIYYKIVGQKLHQPSFYEYNMFRGAEWNIESGEGSKSNFFKEINFKFFSSYFYMFFKSIYNHNGTLKKIQSDRVRRPCHKVAPSLHAYQFIHNLMNYSVYRY
jgi:hypothetical protein